MLSLSYIITSIFSISLFSNDALGKSISDSCVESKLHALEKAVQRAGCQEYLAHGYKYEHMYPIDGVAFDNVVVEKEDGHLTGFEMHIAIKAEKDGIILLSPVANPGANDLVFELGAGIAGNQFTILRITKDSSNEVARVPTAGLLSTTHYKKFFISISNDVLTFGVEGDEPLISYSDIRLRGVKYFDISSWGVIDAKFLYDCPAPTKIY